MGLTRSGRDASSAGHAVADDPLITKLSLFIPLTASDKGLLATVASHDETFGRDVDIVAEGQAPRTVFVVKEGMAVRYRNLADGRRQIMTFLIPGDLCDAHVFLLKTMDHSIGTITPVRIASISRDGMMALLSSRPRLAAALWWSSQQEEAMLRERIVTLGRRNARSRISYLLCELLWRYRAVGLAEADGFRLPLTQTELGDTLGLTAVHVNRVLRELREGRLISLERGIIKLLDVDALQQIAGFNQDYLHFGGASEELAQYLNAAENG